MRVTIPITTVLAMLGGGAEGQVRTVADGSDLGAQINRCVDSLPSGGGVCDARALGGARSAAVTVALTGKPVALLLSPSLILTCASSANPCISFGSNVRIEGHTGGTDGTHGTLIRTTAGANTLLAPSHPGANTSFLVVDGITFFNAASATGVVVNLTNASQVFIQHSSILKSGGPTTLVLVTRTDSNVAYYNTFLDVRLDGGTGGGIGYEIANGANDVRVLGGKIANVTTVTNIRGADSTAWNVVNGVTFFDVSAEQYSTYVFNISQWAYGIRWFGGRMETSLGGQIFAVGATGTHDIYVYAPILASGETWGTDNGRVLWVGSAPGTSPQTTQLTLEATNFTDLNGMSPPAGTIRYCSNCVEADTCAAGGGGAMARRIGTTWKCR